MTLKIVVVLTMTQTCLPYATSASERSRPDDTVAPPPLNWRNLEFHDTGVTASVTTRVELKEPAAA